MVSVEENISGADLRYHEALIAYAEPLHDVADPDLHICLTSNGYYGCLFANGKLAAEDYDDQLEDHLNVLVNIARAATPACKVKVSKIVDSPDSSVLSVEELDRIYGDDD